MNSGESWYTRALGAGMLGVSALFFSTMMMTPAMLIPGLGFGIGGLVLATRRGRAEPAGPGESPDLARRVERIESRLLATQQELSDTQRDLHELREERDFLKALYPGTATGPETAAANPLERIDRRG